MRRPAAWIAAAMVGAVALGLALAWALSPTIDPAELRLASTRLFTDRSGRPLRFTADSLGRRHLWIDGRDLPPLVAQAFMAAEDRRFPAHHGVDWRAVARAARDNLAAGRIVSGASTITMQLTRLIRPRPRTLVGKAGEMLAALKLETTADKAAILTAYLNRVPLGHGFIGVEAAARGYFGCPAARLTPAQAALLAALPTAPSRLSPSGTERAKLLARQQAILDRMARLGYLTLAQAAAEKSRELSFVSPRPPLEAPHAVDMILADDRPKRGIIPTSLDGAIQAEVERIVALNRARLNAGGADQAAVVVIENGPPGQANRLAALAGSVDYGPAEGGYVNGALARRSAGSALKPFLYALALEMGIGPSQVLEDVDRRYRSPGGDYHPVNYDRLSHGPVPFRWALGNSLNLAAVDLLGRVGLAPFHRRLLDLNLLPPGDDEQRYGLGLAVGNAEVRLLDLAQAYSALARGGVLAPLRLTDRDRLPPPRRVFSAPAAFIVTDILADPGARTITFGPGGPADGVALKTGTSTNFRDAWAVAYTRRWTVGVWVGNFDGRPTAGLSGATAAVPIAREIMARLNHGRSRRPSPPPGVVSQLVCSVSGQLPGPNCRHRRREWFIEGSRPSTVCAYHRGGALAHRLPLPFAPWVKDRADRGLAGRYRLAGLPGDLKAAFRPPQPTRPDRLVTGPVTIGPDRPNRIDGRARGEVEVIYPLNGDRFVSGPGGGAINLAARADGPVAAVHWLVNGREVAVTGPPYRTAWNLKPGRYAITALTEAGLGDRITIEVE